ncbi:MAG: CocE/NonD family hydrolase [Bacteroidota bacterium]
MYTFFTLLFTLFFTISGFSQVSPDDFQLHHGSYTVGFKQYNTVDATRTYTRVFEWTQQKIQRPIPISMWYPSTTTNDKKTTILSYLEIFKNEREWESLPNEHLLNWFKYPTNTPHNVAMLPKTTAAFANVPIADGKFPVVIYAPSYEASSIENFMLCEYLASHGYIVISSPSRGATHQYFKGGTHEDMETQARDVEFLIQEVLRVEQADHDKIATMGFSFGGMSNVLAQLRNAYIKAVVSLDGTIRYNYKVLKESPFHDITKADVPFIHFAQKDIPAAVLKADNMDPKLNSQFEFYDRLLYSDAYTLKLHDLTHANFCSFGILFRPRDPRQDKSDEKILASYKIVSTYTLHFLNAYLQNNQTALTFLQNTPEQNGIAKELLSKEFKKATEKPMTFQRFNDIAAKQSYQNMEALHKEIIQKHPNLELPEWKLNNLGLQLNFNPKTSHLGVLVFKFAIYLYPKSANLFDSLAEAYLYAGDHQNAIIHFKKSLLLNPKNQNARKRLKELEK